MLKAAQTPPRLSTLILVTALSVLSLNMFLPSLANIAESFGVDYAWANLSVAGYLGITAVLQVIMGPLSDRYGRRPVMLWGLVIFVIASVGCLLAQDIWVFLGFRMLQGAVITGMALSRAVVRDLHPPQEAAAMLGYISMVMAVAPMTGPMVGGFLDELFGWRSTFVFFVLAGIGMLWLCWTDLGETNTQRSKTIGAQFSSYPDLLKSRRFWGYSVCLTFSLGGFYIYITGAALIGGAVFGLSPAMIGVSVGAITGGFAVGSFLSMRLSKRYPLWLMVMAGRLCAAAGLCLGLGLVLSGVLHPVSYAGAVMFVGLGNGLSIPAANSGVMSVRPQLAGSAAGLSGAMSVAGGAVLTSMTGAFLTAENGAVLLLVMMLGSVSVSLAAAAYVRWLDLREPLPS